MSKFGVIFVLCWFGLGGIFCLIAFILQNSLVYFVGVGIEIVGLVIIFIIIYLVSLT